MVLASFVFETRRNNKGERVSFGVRERAPMRQRCCFAALKHLGLPAIVSGHQRSGPAGQFWHRQYGHPGEVGDSDKWAVEDPDEQVRLAGL